jgi:hypothetical protein
MYTNAVLFQESALVCAANRLRDRAFCSVEPGPSESRRGGCPSVHNYGARVLLGLLCTAARRCRTAAETGGCPGYAGCSVGAELAAMKLGTRPCDHLRALWCHGEVLGPSRCRSPAFLWTYTEMAGLLEG